jgi:hypothetical protein
VQKEKDEHARIRQEIKRLIDEN